MTFDSQAGAVQDGKRLYRSRRGAVVLKQTFDAGRVMTSKPEVTLISGRVPEEWARASKVP